MKNFESVLEVVGSFGLYQKKVYALIFIAGIPCAFSALHFIFSNYVPDFRCRLPKVVNDQLAENNTDIEFILNLTIPLNKDQYGDLRRSQCFVYNRNYTEIFASNFTFDLNESNVTYCANGWVYDIEPGQGSAVTDFNLVCRDSWKIALIVSCFSIGNAVGSAISFVSDKYGRRPVFLVTAICQFLALGLTGLSWNYVGYALFTFLCGTGNFLNYSTGIILASEVTGVKKRNFIALSAFISFGFGYFILSAVAYFVRKWPLYLLTLALLSLAMETPFYWLLPESARWLLVSGKKAEAKKELKRMARMNGKHVDIDELFNKFDEEDEKLLEDSNVDQKQEKREMLKLVKDPVTRGRFYSIFFAWMVTSMVYYAVTLYSTDFSTNRFLNGLLPAFFEILGSVGSFFIVEKMGRPRSITVCMFNVTLTCFVLCVLPRDWFVLKSIVALLGKSSGGALFYQVYVIGGELPPTLQRNTSVGISSCFARVGAFVAPYLMLISNFSYEIPYIIMGFFSLASGTLCYFFIPETKDVVMPDNFEDVKQNVRFYRWKFWRNKFGSDHIAKKQAMES